jgi:GT2 family glycosyltransferase
MTAVCAIVVTYECERLVDSCLDAIEEALAACSLDSRSLVVDNRSTDRTREIVASRFPKVELLALGSNRGFPYAVNAGVAASAAEWILLVNPDMRLAPDAVEELLSAASGRPDVGSVAAEVRFAADPRVVNSAGIEVDTLGIAVDRGLGTLGDETAGEPYEVFGVSGGAALYRRAMLEDVGGFDSSFFLYLEDVDVAWRARARGWRALCAPRARALHEHSATTGHGSSKKLFHVGRNRVRLLAKNADRRQLVRHGMAMVAYDLAYVAFVALTKHDLAPARGRLAGLREWRRYRARRTPTARVQLAPARGLRAALARNRAWDRYSAAGHGPQRPTTRAAMAANRSAPASLE